VNAGMLVCPFEVLFVSFAWYIFNGPSQRNLSHLFATLFVIPSLL